MLHGEHTIIDGSSLIFVILLPQNGFGKKKRTLYKDKGKYNLPKEEVTKGEICRTNLLQALLKVSLRLEDLM